MLVFYMLVTRAKGWTELPWSKLVPFFRRCRGRRCFHYAKLFFSRVTGQISTKLCKLKMFFFSSLNQSYDILIICVYWIGLISQVRDVAHGPIVIYSMMGLLIYKYEPLWQEVCVKSLILRCLLRPVGLLFLYAGIHHKLRLEHNECFLCLGTRFRLI